MQSAIIGGSWVVTSRIIIKSPDVGYNYTVTLLTDPLITTHEPPNKGFLKGVQGWSLGFPPNLLVEVVRAILYRAT